MISLCFRKNSEKFEISMKLRYGKTKKRIAGNSFINDMAKDKKKGKKEGDGRKLLFGTGSRPSGNRYKGKLLRVSYLE